MGTARRWCPRGHGAGAVLALRVRQTRGMPERSFVHEADRARNDRRPGHCDALGFEEPSSPCKICDSLILKRTMAKVGRYEVPEDWPVKGEAGRTFNDKLKNGFFSTYMAGEVTVDVRDRGGFESAGPTLPHATGGEIDHPPYARGDAPFAHLN